MRSLGVKNKRKCKKKGLKMKTIEQLKAEIKAFLEEMRRLKALCETEKREFSEDEGKKIDETMSKIGDNRAEIERLEKLESRKNKLAALDSELNQPEVRATKPSEPEIRTEKARFTLPASARSTRCSFIKDDNYTGMRANERAYRIGMWIAATRGNRKAQRFCLENGIEIVGWDDKNEKEVRLHSEDINYQGGYLVPEEVDNAIIDLKEQYGVFRGLARRSPMGSDTKNRSRRKTGLTAYFVGEAAQITESSKTWDNVQLVAKKIGVLTRMTNELGEDAAINVADDLIGEIAYAFANKEDECGFNGDGTSTYGTIFGVCPKLKAVSGTIANIKGLVVATGNLFSEFALADFNGVVSILPEYADTPSTVWVCHKVFWGSVMQKLMHAAGGNTVMDLQGKVVKSFMGYPVVISQVMPKTDANSQIACLLGDFSLAADFGDRRMTSVAFSEHATVGGESVFEYDEVAVRGTERFDINVHDIGDTSAAGPVVGLISAAS